MKEPYLLSAIPDKENVASYQPKLISAVKEWCSGSQRDNISRAINWETSLRFFAGDQWLRYNQAVRRLESIPYSQNQENIERPVTNHFLRWIVSSASMFSNRPHITIDPNSEEPSDKMAARCGKIILDLSWEKGDKSTEYYLIALAITMMGLCYRRSYKTDRLAYIGDEYLQETASEIVLPHRITVDLEARSWKDVTDIMDSVPRRIDWVKQVYGKSGNGFTGNIEGLCAEKIDDPLQALYEGTKHIVEGGNKSFTFNGYGSDYQLKNSVLLRTIYSRPCKAYPKGRQVVVAGNRVLYDSMLSESNQSEYYYLGGDVWHPYTRAAFIEFPASLYPLSLGVQCIPIQSKINKIDALRAYNRKTMAIGQWLIPNGSGIKDGEITGQPGQDIRYNITGMGNALAVPQKVQGIALSNDVLKERADAIQEGDMLSFAAGLKSGENPSGVNTLGQMQILKEEAEQARSKQIESWESFLEKSEQLDLLNFQDVYRIPDIDIVRELTGISKDISNEQWKKFIGSDLKDNASVRIERGSTIIQSKILRQNTILNLARAGLLPEIMTDPVARKDFMTEFGLTKLFSDNNKDVKSAEYAIEKMLDGEYPPILDIYNPDIQLLVLVRYMKDPKFLELPQDIRALFNNRKDAYMSKIAESIMRAPTTTNDAGIANPSMESGNAQSHQGLDMMNQPIQ